MPIHENLEEQNVLSKFGGTICCFLLGGGGSQKFLYEGEKSILDAYS